MTFTTFLYLSLAAWRLASLISNEDGPWQMFKRLRMLAERWCNKYKFCSELGLHELVTCEWCNSVWIGETILYLALPLALSTVVIIIKYVVQTLQTAQKYFETNKVNE